MDSHERDRQVILRNLEPVLDGDLVAALRVVGSERPAAGPELDPGEAPERAGAPRLVAFTQIFVVAFERRARLVRCE
jgi:hypothetical protein